MTRKQEQEQEQQIVAKAKIAHDLVCKCDPKYLMSCTKMAQAILDTANG
jgi:hypothetical protein